MSGEADPWVLPSGPVPTAGRRVMRWQPSRGVLRTRLLLFLSLLDLVVILGSFLFVGALHSSGGAQQGLVIGLAMLSIYFLSAFSSGAFAVSLIDRRSKGVACALRSMLFAAGAVLFAAFYLRASADLSRVIVAGGTLVSLAALAVARSLFLRNARRIIGGNPYNVVLLSDGGAFRRTGAGEYSTILAASSFEPGRHDPMMYDRLAVALQKADRVVVACSAERRHAWVHALQGANVQGEVLTPELAALAPLGVAHFGEDPTLIVAKGPLGVEERLVKRLFDIAVACGALLLLAPVFAAIALAIRMESPGPVLFVQRRIGRGNRMFHMLKFRSMRPERCDEDGSASTTRDDDRITRVGRLLRRTSLDELPQLVNVLAGNMSIVGPRPHALGSRAEDQLFWEIDDRYWHRHAAKPGLTGLAQVRGYRGATNHRSDLVNRLQADLEYLHGWTIWRDMLIVAQTVRVLVHRNAY